MIRLIIFDWDDTIVFNAREGYINCYKETLAELNIAYGPLKEKIAYLETIGPTSEEEIKKLFQDKPKMIPLVQKVYQKHLFGQTFLQTIKILPGTGEQLKNLSYQYTLSLATGCHPKLIKIIIKEFHLPDVFSQIVSHHQLKDFSLAKPNPFMVNKILATQKIDPQEAVMVGDSAFDIQMASAAGVMPITVLSGHIDATQAQDLGAKYIIPDITYLEAVLNKL